MTVYHHYANNVDMDLTYTEKGTRLDTTLLYWTPEVCLCVCGGKGGGKEGSVGKERVTKIDLKKNRGK